MPLGSFRRMDSVDVRIVPSCTPVVEDADEEHVDLVLRSWGNVTTSCRRLRRRNTKNRPTRTIKAIRDPRVPARTLIVAADEVAGGGAFGRGDAGAVEVVVEVDRAGECSAEVGSVSTTCWVTLDLGETKKCCRI